MKQLKVLHICRNVDGGVAKVVERLARNQINSKYKPIILFNDKKMTFFHKSLIESKIMVLELGKNNNAESKNSKRPAKPFRIGEKIQKYFGHIALDLYLSLKALLCFIRYDLKKVHSVKNIIKKHGIDIVHSHNDLQNCKSEILACKIARIPFVAHVHLFGQTTSFDKLFNRFIDSFVYISKSVERHHVKLGMPSNKGIVIYNGVDIKEFTKTNENNEIKCEYGITDDDYVIGIIGRIDWWKGHQYFIKAIADASKKTPNVRGLIVGELERSVTVHENEKYYRNLNSMIKKHKLEDKIILTGFKSNIEKILNAIDVVVHASTEPEPFGLVIIEGMAAAKPVIATAAGGVPEIIDHNINGILVPPKNSQAISKEIIKLAHNQYYAKKLGKAAREHIRNTFSANKQMLRIENVYKANLKNSRRDVLTSN
jgi:glycosyltransferase involved in cell wall biosynthesis